MVTLKTKHDTVQLRNSWNGESDYRYFDVGIQDIAIIAKSPIEVIDQDTGESKNYNKGVFTVSQVSYPKIASAREFSKGMCLRRLKYILGLKLIGTKIFTMK